MDYNKPISIIVQGAWHQREENPREALVRACNTLRALSPIHSEYKSWFNPVFCNNEGQAIDISSKDNESTIYDLFISKGATCDDHGQIIRGLGYNLSAYSGSSYQRLDLRTEFSISCCRTTEANLDNNVCIRFPSIGPDVSAVTLNVETHLNVMKCVLELLQPDWLSVQYETGVRCKIWPFGPVVGWINFFSSKIAQIKSLPQEWCIMQFDDRRLILYKDGIPNFGSEKAKQDFEKLKLSTVRLL